MSVLPVGFGSAVASGYQIERSLRFDGAASLTRTFGTPTSRTTWTMNLWFKRSNLGTTQYIFHSRDAGNTVSFECFLNTTDNLVVRDYSGSAYNSNYVTTQVFRDPSAWYALTVRWDTTNATAANRCTIFINGVQITAFSTSSAPSQNLQSQWNVSGYLHSIGSFYNVASYYNGYITEVNFLDGQVPTTTTRTVNGVTETILTQLGEFSSSTGVWTPKAWDGTYGTNGFYLPFKTASQWSGYFDGNTDYLSVPHNSSLSPTGDFTIEFWAYTGSTALQEWVTKGYGIQIYSNASNWYAALSSSNNTTYFINGSFGAHSTNTWQHIAISRQGNTYRGFVNGVATTLGTSSSAPSTGTDSLLVGTVGPGTIRYYVTGYLSNLRIVDGTAVYTGNFTPPTSQLTAITNTSLLTCQSSTFVDNSTNAFTVTATGDTRPQQFSPFTLDVTDDHSGQGNHWQPNNLDLRTTGAGADILVDSPTAYGTDTGVGGEVRGNYCTLTPLLFRYAVGAGTLTNGNLQATGSSTYFFSTFQMPATGKWYFEGVPTAGSSTAGIGLSDLETARTVFTSVVQYLNDGNKDVNGSQTSYGASYTTNDVIGVAVDCDAGTITFYKNNASQGAITTTVRNQFVFLQTGGSWTWAMNFGQRAFAYTAPSGFKALCTQNLPPVTIGATSTTQANDYFNAVIWTGDGNNPRTVSGVGFQPDFVWAKLRSAAASHNLYDAVRGVGNVLYSDLTVQEANNNVFGYLSAFNSDGFVASAGSTSNAYFNTLNSTYVAWNWNAGGSTVTNTSGSISAQVRANTTSGFSIVTGTLGAAGVQSTVGHGLNAVPNMILFKTRSGATYNWSVFHTSIATDTTKFLRLNDTVGTQTYSTVWGAALPTTNVFGVTGDGCGSPSNPFVAYCFAPVAGYSAFGKYTGNGSADGPFVYTGFRPRYILVKRTDSADDWAVYDTARDTYNQATKQLRPNAATAQLDPAGVPAVYYDFLSNGFKNRGSNSQCNANGGTYIYAAFAEHPFKYSLAR